MPTIDREEIAENFRNFRNWVESLEKNVEFNERMVSLLSGAALLASAKSSGSFFTGLIGGYMLFRGATGHCSVVKRLQKVDQNDQY
ncbi:MAG: YgaP family membrane protein [Owenweeksia sp.]